jgi:dimethylaniline monooxygenase (N-oxide forming)
MLTNQEHTRVAIIGAGASGLTAIKECLASGITNIVCFEKSDDIGGLWKYEEPKPGVEIHSSVYKNTVINTSKPMMAFSDFPIPQEWPTFLHNSSIMTYFRSYVDHFNLSPFIKFNAAVTSIKPLKPIKESNGHRWEVVYTKGAQIYAEEFDKVIVASGHHWKPLTPPFEGMNEFKGEILHSHYYREAPPYKNQTCMIVGIGNSAVDLAVELSFHAKQVHLSTRSNAWVIPRYAVTGCPGDQVLSRFFYWIPMFIRNWIFRLAIWLQWGNIARYGFTPKHEPFSAHPTVNGELYARIGTGTVKIQKNIKKFKSTPGKKAKGQVEFEDGTVIDVDVVIMCTGYEIGFPFLDAQKICGLKNNSVQMYKYVWPLEFTNIAFVGLIQPLGSIMPISELQSRWIARIFSNNAKLPTQSEMRKDVEKLKREMESRYIKSQRHTIQVDYGPYCDAIGVFFVFLLKIV